MKGVVTKGGARMPFCKMTFITNIDQGIFKSALFPSKYHKTFKFGKAYPTVYILLRVLRYFTVIISL